MSIDTATKEGRQKRIEEIADGYARSGNKRALTRVVGLSPSDWDYIPGQDDGEPPHGARWE